MDILRPTDRVTVIFFSVLVFLFFLCNMHIVHVFTGQY